LARTNYLTVQNEQLIEDNERLREDGKYRDKIVSVLQRKVSLLLGGDSGTIELPPPTPTPATRLEVGDVGNLEDPALLSADVVEVDSFKSADEVDVNYDNYEQLQLELKLGVSHIPSSSLVQTVGRMWRGEQPQKVVVVADTDVDGYKVAVPGHMSQWYKAQSQSHDLD